MTVNQSYQLNKLPTFLGNYYLQIISPLSCHFGLSHTDGPGSTNLSRHGFFASKKVKNNKLEEVEPRLILLHNQQALIF